MTVAASNSRRCHSHWLQTAAASGTQSALDAAHQSKIQNLKSKICVRATFFAVKFVALLLLAFWSGATTAGEQERGEALPQEFKDVGITERLNELLPLDLKFTDDSGQVASLRSYFKPGRPVLLALVYYRCPMLCNLVLQGMAEGLRGIPGTAGREFECVVLSFDPLETYKLAAATKQTFLERYGRPGGGEGIHFLTGAKDNIAALAAAIGFVYKWDEAGNQYAHAAAIYACTPEGRLSCYLYGISFEPRNLRLALLDASAGKSGSFGDQVLSFCYHFDPATHTYTIAAQRLMTAGGIVTLVLLALFFGTVVAAGVEAARPQDGGVSGLSAIVHGLCSLTAQPSLVAHCRTAVSVLLGFIAKAAAIITMIKRGGEGEKGRRGEIPTRQNTGPSAPLLPFSLSPLLRRIGCCLVLAMTVCKSGYASATLGVEDGGTFWFPPAASREAVQSDWLFFYVFYICLFFFVLIVGLMVYMVLRFRRREGVAPQPSPSHHTVLEITWTFIPVCLVGSMFFLGSKTFMDQRTPPSAAYQIQVRGQQWFWSFAYPNGYESVPEGENLPELHVPVDTPIDLTMTSLDVSHGFFIPAFRIKQDVVPGRYTHTWFTATVPGEYVIYCTQYCGTSHSMMRAWCVVHPDRASFESWLSSAKEKTQAAMTPAQRGQRLYAGKGGCVQCHTTDGRAMTGPSFKDVYGSPQTLSDGRTITADDNYIREHILDPGITVVRGYQNVMPSFRGRLSYREISDLIAFLQSLSQSYRPVPAAQEGTIPKAAPAKGEKK